MKRRNITIKYCELPKRAARLESGKFSKIFGGCGATGDGCMKGIGLDSCCPGHFCGTIMFSGFAPGTLQNGTCN
jgi:hypothetical protein